MATQRMNKYVAWWILTLKNHSGQTTTKSLWGAAANSAEAAIELENKRSRDSWRAVEAKASYDMTEGLIEDRIEDSKDEFLVLLRAGTLTLEGALHTLSNLGDGKFLDMDLMQIAGLATATALYQAKD